MPSKFKKPTNPIKFLKLHLEGSQTVGDQEIVTAIKIPGNSVIKGLYFDVQQAPGVTLKIGVEGTPAKFGELSSGASQGLNRASAWQTEVLQPGTLQNLAYKFVADSTVPYSLDVIVEYHVLPN